LGSGYGPFVGMKVPLALLLAVPVLVVSLVLSTLWALLGPEDPSGPPRWVRQDN
jgi:hypothetical protein